MRWESCDELATVQERFLMSDKAKVFQVTPRATDEPGVYAYDVPGGGSDYLLVMDADGPYIAGVDDIPQDSEPWTLPEPLRAEIARYPELSYQEAEALYDALCKLPRPDDGVGNFVVWAHEQMGDWPRPPAEYIAAMLNGPTWMTPNCIAAFLLALDQALRS